MSLPEIATQEQFFFVKLPSGYLDSHKCKSKDFYTIPMDGSYVYKIRGQNASLSSFKAGHEIFGDLSYLFMIRSKPYIYKEFYD